MSDVGIDFINKFRYFSIEECLLEVFLMKRGDIFSKD